MTTRITNSGLMAMVQAPLELEYTRIKRFEDPWIDPRAAIFNDKKHRETCIKNRKRRKSKRKR